MKDRDIRGATTSPLEKRVEILERTLFQVNHAYMELAQMHREEISKLNDRFEAVRALAENANTALDILQETLE